MVDRNGVPLKIGDNVRLWRGNCGYVVCDFDSDQFTDKYPRSDWDHVKMGILVEMNSGELFHYNETDEDIERVEK
jgi:hypothetical protein